jgi:ADP-heptose:LPS heptosyltransferase
MKRILVHNFTRFGDLLQSTPLLMGLKTLYPDSEIVLAVYRCFQEICEGFPFVDMVISFDGDGLKDAVLRSGDGLLQGYRYVRSYADMLREKRFDLVINLSHSRASCIFLALLQIPQVIGSIADRSGALYTVHPWANYFRNMSLHRVASAFNLVDVYRRMGDVPAGPRRLIYEVPPSAQAVADRWLRTLFGHALDGEDPPMLIGLQPGASQDSRRWPAAAFAQLGKALCDDLGARIIVFGTADEAAMGEVIVQACRGRALSLMGQTSLAQLAAVLQRCRLLITNDTGTMHLACAVGTQVIALFMGPALFHQTGPYGEGHVVLQAEIPCAPCNYLVRCTNQVCKEQLRWKNVLEIVKWVIAGCSHPAPELTPGMGGYRGTFDDDGYLHFVPLARRRLDSGTLMRLVHREAWKVILDHKPLSQAVASINKELTLHYQWQDAEGELSQTQAETAADCHRLRVLAEQGGALCQELREEAQQEPLRIGRVRALGQALEELDAQIHILGSTREALKPLLMAFRFGKENLQGWELLSLAQQSQHVYESLGRQAHLVSQILGACSVVAAPIK